MYGTRYFGRSATGVGARCLTFGADSLPHFLAIHGHVVAGCKTQFHGSTANFEHRYTYQFLHIVSRSNHD